MACAKLPFRSGMSLRIPAPVHVQPIAKFSSVVCMTSKPKPKGLVIATQGTAGVEAGPNGCVSADTTKLPQEMHTHETQDQQQLSLPPLLASLMIDGIPPRQEIAADVLAAADEQMAAIAAREWPKSDLRSNSSRTTFMEYCRVAMTMCQFYYPDTGVERLVPLSIMFGFMFFIDDIYESPWKENIAADFALDPDLPWEYIRDLDELLRGEEPPPSPSSPLQHIMWEVGKEMKRLSTPGFLAFWMEAVLEHDRVVLSSHADFAGERATMLDLETYTAMRVGNSGGHFTASCLEFATGEFLPDDLRVHPLTAQLRCDVIAHFVYVNDIFSYSKEVREEENLCNIITLLMESGGMSLPQAAWRAIEIANSYHTVVMDLERRLRVSESVEGIPSKSLLGYLSRLKDFYAGNLYWSSVVGRYRVADAVFPELRVCYPHYALE